MSARGWFVLCLGAALAASMLPAPAAAQQSQNWKWCVNNEKASLDLQISGCTAVIQSGKESAKNLAVAFMNRGNALDDKGEFERAIADYSQAVRLDPKYTRAFSNRGRLYLNKGNYDSAIADFSRTVKLDPKHADAFNNRGRSYYAKKDND